MFRLHLYSIFECYAWYVLSIWMEYEDLWQNCDIWQAEQATVQHSHVILSLKNNSLPLSNTQTCMHSKRKCVTSPHLASWLGSFPDAKVADEPGQGQTHGQLPAHSPHVLNTIWYLQYPASDWAQRTQRFYTEDLHCELVHCTCAQQMLQMVQGWKINKAKRLDEWCAN